MQFMSSSLGVNCTFCHDEKAFDKDTKDEKVTAREMIAMQEGINRGHFKGKREVTCNSCHHGAQHPAATPALRELSEAIPERCRSTSTERTIFRNSHPPPSISMNTTSRRRRGRAGQNQHPLRPWRRRLRRQPGSQL